jgi:hypothetical protein
MKIKKHDFFSSTLKEEDNACVHVIVFFFWLATASTVEEASKLVEAGFEYVCDVEGFKLFRKPK